MRLAGIQTHIEHWTDPDTLRALRAKGYRLARIAAMECSDASAWEMVRDAKDAGFIVVVTLADPERMRLLAPLLDPAMGDFVECRNEDDGDLWARLRGLAMWPADYRAILDAFCRVGLELGIPIGGPTCSNTNQKCIDWARSVKGAGWPAGMRYLTWHSYDPHENTAFVEMEALADGLPIVLTEFGYPSMGQTPEAEAEQATTEQSLWRRYAPYHAACKFQLNDGPDPAEREHCYGIRRHDGSWKPNADVPQETIIMADTDIVIHRVCLIPLDAHGKPGKYSAFVKPGNTEEIVAVDDRGNVAVHSAADIGKAYETFSLSSDGQVAVFDESGPLARGVRVV